jgi:hypothetical protein
VVKPSVYELLTCCLLPIGSSEQPASLLVLAMLRLVRATRQISGRQCVAWFGYWILFCAKFCDRLFNWWKTLMTQMLKNDILFISA